MITTVATYQFEVEINHISLFKTEKREMSTEFADRMFDMFRRHYPKEDGYGVIMLVYTDKYEGYITSRC